MELKGFEFPMAEQTDEPLTKSMGQWLEVMEHMNQWVAKGKSEDVNG